MSGTRFRSLLVLLVLFLALVAGCATVPPKPILQVTPNPPRQVAAAVAAPVVDAISTPSPEAEPSGAPPIAKKPGSISAEEMGLYRSMEEARAAPSEIELKVVASAKLLLGKAPNARVVVNGREFVLDCIGTVSAVYYRLDIDVTKDFALYSGNGVNRFYMSLQEQKALHTDDYPRPGDAIVWDNTWDANGDADRTNDPRTHAGIVLAVDDDGTIYYVHENLNKGVVIEMMNLLHPDQRTDETGKVINSGLAIATVSGGPRPEHSLSGDVFNAFGDVLGVKDHFAAKVSTQKPPAEATVQTVSLQQ